MNPEQLEPNFSQPSALALSNMEEGMGHNADRAWELQDELAQRRASLHHDSAEAQALQGKEALLANIIEEEMAHWTQVLVLSHLHLQQAKEISCCEYHESHEDSPRKQRLDVIRRIFLSTYSSLIDLHHNGLGTSTSDGNSTGIGGLLENFAEKVGFRIPRSTAV